MNIREELIKYAKWFDRCTMPGYEQTPEADLIQTVDNYLHENFGKCDDVIPECVICGVKKQTHEICIDCLEDVIKENQHP